jgi:hypothetical protein
LKFHGVDRRRGLWHTRFVAKRPRDPVQLAKQVFDIAIGEAEDTVSESKRHPSNRRVGGLKGGASRARKLSPYNANEHETLYSANERFQ